MSSGLLALVDDVVALAKLAAVTLDDTASQVATVGAKAAGVVVDDAAVTPRYVVGFAAERELPIVARIAWGSVKNKLLYLLPAAMALAAFAPWLITPLLMAGGLFLCFEGYEKVHDWLAPPKPQMAAKQSPSGNARAIEDARVAGAIRTDLILSAEIMAISLASIKSPSLIMQAIILALVGIGITILVYGAVALIVKADDIGVALARSDRPASGFGDILCNRPPNGVISPIDSRLAPVTQAIGRALVRGMPPFLKLLGVVGTLAMLWVGGGIIVHGLAGLGVTAPEHAIAAASAWLGAGPMTGLLAAALSGLIGLALGAIVALLLHPVERLWNAVTG